MKNTSLSWSLLEGFRCINQEIPTYLFGILIIFLWSNSLAAQSSNMTKLTASDGTGGNEFGYSVSISGDQLVVGAWGNDYNGFVSGSVYVYEKDANGSWGSEQQLTPSDAAHGDFFGRVSISGDQLVVGAWGDDDNGTNSGSVYVYEKDANGTWGNEQKLTASDAGHGDHFGKSVSISGNQLVVGANLDDDNNNNSGSVYVYEKDANGSWGSEQKLMASDGAIYDHFGKSVSISGDELVVGAPLDDDNGFASGSVYVYEKDANGIWGSEQQLTASDGVAGDHFGYSVSISGDQLVVGAWGGDDDNGESSGSVYVYEKDVDGTWGNEQKLTPSDGTGGDEFGYSVSISGDQLVVGARNDDDNGESSGSVYAYEKDANGTWVNEQKFTAFDAAADDWFGYSVSISGDQLVVGANGDDDNGSSSGSAYFIDLDNICSPICNDLTIELDNSGNTSIIAEDIFGGYDGACTMSSLELNLTTFDSSNVGDNLVTLTVYDSSNNSSSCQAIITVNSTTDNKQLSTDKFCLYQNIPNPFNEQTIIRFNLTESGKVILTITNVDGKVIERIEGDYTSGMHTIELMNLQKSGVYYYQLETERFSGTKKMIKI